MHLKNNLIPYLLFSLVPSFVTALGITRGNSTSLANLIASDPKTNGLLQGLSFSNTEMVLYTLAVTKYTGVSDITVALWMSNWQDSVKQNQTSYSQPPVLCNNTYTSGLSVDKIYQECYPDLPGETYLWGVSKVFQQNNASAFELTLTHAMNFRERNFTLYFSAYLNVTSDMLGPCDPTNRKQPLDTPPVTARQGSKCTQSLNGWRTNGSSIDISNVYYTIP